MNKQDYYLKKMNKNIVSNEGINNVLQVLRSGYLSKPEGGIFVKKFQNRMAKLHNKKFGFAVTSGTSSLHAIIATLGLKKNDEILIPALTFMADASVVIQQHAKPIFVDIGYDDFNIDPEDVIKKITKNTKALIIVHLFGQPAKMDELQKIAKKYKLIIIEDCAQAIGATYNHKPVGSFGELSCFSFYQTKHLITGEGGMILTNNLRYSTIFKSILNNGIKRSNLDAYDFDHIGFNYQMTEIHAALGTAQLKRIKILNKKRRELVKIYKKILINTDIQFQKELDNTQSAYCYLSAILPSRMRNKRDLFVKKVLSQGVPLKKQYPLTLPETKICRSMSYDNSQSTPIAVDISRRIFNMSVNPGLDKKDIENFANIILKVFNELND
jgi:perosamine synthetase